MSDAKNISSSYVNEALLMLGLGLSVVAMLALWPWRPREFYRVSE